MSLVKEGFEKDIFINPLYSKYRSLFMGCMSSGLFKNEFPLHFTFTSKDINSIKAKVKDKSDILHSSQVDTFTIEGMRHLNLADIDSFIVITPFKLSSSLTFTDEIDTHIILRARELALVTATTDNVVISGNAEVKTITCM